MALTQLNTITSSALARSYSRNGQGLMFNHHKIEMYYVSKLAGDTSGTITLSRIRNAQRVFIFDLTNNTADAAAKFTYLTPTTISISPLANWTLAVVMVAGVRTS